MNNFDKELETLSAETLAKLCAALDTEMATNIQAEVYVTIWAVLLNKFGDDFYGTKKAFDMVTAAKEELVDG